MAESAHSIVYAREILLSNILALCCCELYSIHPYRRVYAIFLAKCFTTLPQTEAFRFFMPKF